MRKANNKKTSKQNKNKNNKNTNTMQKPTGNFTVNCHAVN